VIKRSIVKNNKSEIIEKSPYKSNYRALLTGI